eukprot:TRINITY_DN2254_c0_g1_i2.p1 TRINITY_DN2254_c0_g1~~TRINITY_DN2254_c0_g1_i2.p1  ORF type:complete len:249 (-),score=52.75 TRINITY_DN2254_c0_g1_i2:19-765(-)
MMNDINVTTGSRVDIHTCSLPRATYVKFQPQSVDFLEITDPKAALEYHLRSFACLTCNSHLLMKYGAKDYYLKVLEIKPVSQYKAVSIIETDFVVDFEAPVGYVEPQRVVKEPEYVSQDGDLDPSQIHDEDDSEEEKPKFTVFSGSGVRISGKKVDEPASVVNNLAKSTKNEVKKPFLNSKGELVYLTEAQIEALKSQTQNTATTNSPKASPATTPNHTKPNTTTTTTPSNSKPSDSPKFPGTGYKVK